MQTTTDVRDGEETIRTPQEFQAGLWFIGSIRTPWKTRRECPRRGDLDGPVCRIVVDEPWRRALQGLGRHSHLHVLYWMHEARRDLVTQKPNHTGVASGTFTIRSPNRPNPIAVSIVEVVELHDDGVSVRGLDCLDGTTLVDLKPETCPHDRARPGGG